MAKDSVTFDIDGHLFAVAFDRSRLALGSIVYVEYSPSGEPVAFAPENAKGRIFHWVRWISMSDWYVILVKEFQCGHHFVQRVENAVGEFISRDEISTTLKAFADIIRPSHLYMTSELERNPLSVVFTVLERLEVVDILNRSVTARELFSYREPLVSYLLLTCFDRLGQPTEWLEFGAWLKSDRHKDEREKALHTAKKIDDLTEGCKLLHSHYLALYGVKSSFFRFLREVLPTSDRNALLGSIDITKSTYPPSQELLGAATDDEKERYLFKRRNDYTHKAAFTPPAGGWLERSFTNHVQDFRKGYWTDTVTNEWPAVLERIVRIGLASYLRQAQQLRA